MKLTDIDTLNSVSILDIKTHEELQKRFYELGLHLGQSIRVVRKIPLRGPVLIELNDSVLALRYEEAECIHVKI